MSRWPVFPTDFFAAGRSRKRGEKGCFCIGSHKYNILKKKGGVLPGAGWYKNTLFCSAKGLAYGGGCDGAAALFVLHDRGSAVLHGDGDGDKVRRIPGRCSRTLATVACAKTYIDDSGAAAQLAEEVLSVVYAKKIVDSETGDTSAVKGENMALSRVIQEDEMIDLMLTYRI